MSHQLNIFIVHSPRHPGVQAHATLVSDSHRNLYFVNSANVLACLCSGSRAALLLPRLHLDQSLLYTPYP